MTSKYLLRVVFVALFCVQFLVIPTFANMAEGGKVAVFSFFILGLAVYLVLQGRVLHLPKVLIPLICLFFVFSFSLLSSQWPYVGIVQLFTYGVGLIFCLLVINLATDRDFLLNSIFAWFRIIGLVVAILCLYQYVDWVLFGPKATTLIPYLLPPGSSRVTGVYGQANLTALLLAVSMIAYFSYYLSDSTSLGRYKQFYIDISLLLVSTAFFLAKSLGGLLGFYVFLCLLLLLIYRKKMVFQRRKLLKVFLLLSAGYIISHLPLSDVTYTKSQINIESRYIFWTASFLMFLKSPWLGVGLDHFKMYIPTYARPSHDLLGFVQFEAMGYTNWSHNEYLQVLAESGLVGFLLLLIFSIWLIRIFYVEAKSVQPDSRKLILYLMFTPFFVQGMFSWNFRHPALFFVFFLLLGLAVSDAPYLKIKIKNSIKLLFSVLIIASFYIVIIGTYKEYEYVQLKKQIKNNGCQGNEIFSLIDDPYLEFKILRELLPLCLKDDSFLDNQILVERLEPYFLKITRSQGTHSQWYNLGLIYRSLGEYDLAESSFRESVERQPVFELGWAVLHAIHIEEAARQTGQPIEDFLPPEKSSSVDFDNLFSN